MIGGDERCVSCGHELDDHDPFTDRCSTDECSCSWFVLADPVCPPDFGMRTSSHGDALIGRLTTTGDPR